MSPPTAAWPRSAPENPEASHAPDSAASRGPPLPPWLPHTLPSSGGHILIFFECTPPGLSAAAYSLTAAACRDSWSLHAHTYILCGASWTHTALPPLPLPEQAPARLLQYQPLFL